MFSATFVPLCDYLVLAVTICDFYFFLLRLSVKWPPPNGDFLFYPSGNTLPRVKASILFRRR